MASQTVLGSTPVIQQFVKTDSDLLTYSPLDGEKNHGAALVQLQGFKR
jgi:hypothetical protein